MVLSSIEHSDITIHFFDTFGRESQLWMVFTIITIGIKMSKHNFTDAAISYLIDSLTVKRCIDIYTTGRHGITSCSCTIINFNILHIFSFAIQGLKVSVFIIPIQFVYAYLTLIQCRNTSDIRL